MRTAFPLRIARLLALVLAAAMPLGGVWAQMDSGSLRDSAHAYRDLRAVQGRSVTQPGLAARDAVNSQQQLLRSGQGVALDPTQRRVERGLEGLSGPRSDPGTFVGPQRLPAPDLPASYDDDQLLPRSSTTGLAQTLLDRAADGLQSGRTDQARSDLTLAEQQLQSLSPNELADPASRSAVQRAAELRRQLP